MTKKQKLKHEFLMHWLKNVQLARPKDSGEEWVRDYNEREVSKQLNDLLQFKLTSFKGASLDSLTPNTNDITLT